MEKQNTFETFGECFRHSRTMLGLTLRQFCERNGFDPGNISRIERGLSAPAEKHLVDYAKALMLPPESSEWDRFSDLASIAAGKIPPGILSDPELVHRLPVLLRTIGDKRLTSRQLDELLERIRKA